MHMWRTTQRNTRKRAVYVIFATILICFKRILAIGIERWMVSGALRGLRRVGARLLIERTDHGSVGWC